jgi:phage shock protein C
MLLAFLLPVVSIPLYLVLWLLIPDQNGTIVLERLIGKR